MSQKKHKNLGKQSAKKMGVKIAVPAEKRPEVKEANYLILLINCTDLCMVLGRVNQGAWFAIPKICRTCTSDPDTCFDQHAWAAVMNCQCNDSPFDLTLATQPDPSGHATGATWNITPDCQHAGGVIALT